jgi:amidase
MNNSARFRWAAGLLGGLWFITVSASDAVLVIGRDGNHCAEDAACFNRLHPDIPMAAEAEPGQTIIFKTRNAGDFELDPNSTRKDSRGAGPFMGAVHPVTGPVHIKGARPGDVLAVTILGIDPGTFGFTIIGDSGLVSDHIPGPARALWRLNREQAVSEDIPGVRIPNASFPGIVTVMPGPEQHRTMLQREAALAAAGGAVSLPVATGAVPAELCGPEGSKRDECLRTIPPREHGGNMDIRYLGVGVTIYLPCYVDGCGLGFGDLHFAQGDGELSGTAIEMDADVTVTTRIIKDGPELSRGPHYEGPARLLDIPSQRFYATTGFPLKKKGEVPPDLAYLNSIKIRGLENLSKDISQAGRNALLAMIDYMVATYGLTREQAYLVASVAVDLRIGQLVDVPNVGVTAILPLDIFDPVAASGFSVVEATIPEMQTALAEGRVTSRELVSQYLARIGLYENKINAAISVNAQALAEADRLDRERAAGKLRGPLHGIPVALKDNIHTTHLPTTAGTLAFDGYIPPYEATLTKNLREGGAIILAKTVMTEMANWMVLGMPNNYSAVGGYAFNPYDPRRDPRPGKNDGRGVLATGSSSSGAGTAANLWAANVGTETTVSIIGPASAAMLAAIKPTVGRISRHGIVPVTFDQDTAGPMTRTVTDAAVMLGVLEGRAPDRNDAATNRCEPPPGNDYTPFLNADGLKGARIGVPRAWFIDPLALPRADKPSGGIPADQKQMMEEVVGILRGAGATVIDPADVPSAVAKRWEDNVLVRGSCSRRPSYKGDDANCSVVLKYGFKRDVTAWLASLGDAAPVATLTQLREWNIANTAAGTLKYAQHSLDVSDEQDLDSVEDRVRYEADRATDIRLAGAEGADAVMQRHNLDALIFAGSRGSSFLAKAGYPSVIVPFGLVANGDGYPAGFVPKPAPLGVSFGGTACSEPRLLELAYAFEQATLRRRQPELNQ